MSDSQAAAFEAWFAELEDNRDRKIDGYITIVRELELRASVRQAEMDRLAIRVRVDENAAKRLKVRLKEWMEAHGEKKIETDRYCVSVRGNGGKQPMDIDPALSVSNLPPELQKVTVTPDNERIREVLANGGEVPGCRLLPRGTSLSIK